MHHLLVTTRWAFSGFTVFTSGYIRLYPSMVLKIDGFWIEDCDVGDGWGYLSFMERYPSHVYSVDILRTGVQGPVQKCYDQEP